MQRALWFDCTQRCSQHYNLLYPLQATKKDRHQNTECIEKWKHHHKLLRRSFSAVSTATIANIDAFKICKIFSKPTIFAFNFICTAQIYKFKQNNYSRFPLLLNITNWCFRFLNKLFKLDLKLLFWLFQVFLMRFSKFFFLVVVETPKNASKAKLKSSHSFMFQFCS